MSLVLVSESAFQSLGIEQQSALANMLLNQIAPNQFDDCMFVDEDTEHDFDGILPDVPRLKTHGKDGRFYRSGVEENSEEAPSAITGIILSRDSSNVLFGFKPNQKERLRLAAGIGLKALLDVKDGYICRQLSNGQAELNSQLSAEQRAEAEAFKIGGAIGKGCIGCPMAKWHATDDGNKRACADTENLLWLDSNLGEPVVVGIVAGNSVRNLRKWIEAAFKFQGKKLNIFSYIVRLAFQGKDENDMPILTFKVMAQCTPEQVKALHGIRSGYRNMLDRASLATAQEGDVHTETRSPVDSSLQEVTDNVIGDLV